MWGWEAKEKEREREGDVVEREAGTNRGSLRPTAAMARAPASRRALQRPMPGPAAAVPAPSAPTQRRRSRRPCPGAPSRSPTAMAQALSGRGAGPLSGPMRRTRARSTAAPSFAPSGEEGRGQCKRPGPAEEKVFLVPSVAAFPHGMSAATGPSLAATKKEFSKSLSNSSASSGGTDSGSSAAVLRPERLHAHNGAPAQRVEAMELIVALTACADSLAMVLRRGVRRRGRGEAGGHEPRESQGGGDVRARDGIGEREAMQGLAATLAAT